jgi:GNAT superfamily N-acetyltransferase
MADAGASIDDYASGFRDRLHAMQRPGQELIDEPGVLGLVGATPRSLDGRVLVLDDRALGLLEARVHELFARVVFVLEQATACHRLLSRQQHLHPMVCTAMVCDDLASIPEPPLPDGLELRPVTTSSPGEGEVALADAAAAAIRSDPTMAPATDRAAFVDYLRSVPNTRYLAAVDADGAVRATAAAAIWGITTGVFFVNTDPSWRGRGTGTAMTAAALRAAAADGAERAYLDASALGLSIYQRLGFASVGTVTQYVDQG